MFIWFLTVTVLISYILVGKYGLKQFDIANVVCCGPIAYVACQHGAYASGVISLCFGLAALLRLYVRNY